ncbi:MAG: OmpA family protein, partial [Actinomycetota bacterium]
GEVADQQTVDLLTGLFAGVGEQVTVTNALQIAPDAPAPSGRMSVVDDLSFGSESARVANVEDSVLPDLAAVLVSQPTWRLQIIGHTDSTGAAEFNLTLSEQRADAVRDALVEAGVDPAVITTEGAGAERPIADNSTNDGRAANRRIEFIVTLV